MLDTLGDSGTGEVEADKLLSRVVDLMCDEFNLYHAQVFLLDDISLNAVLAYSRGAIGQQLIEHAKNITRELGITHLLLDTWAFNTMAQQFFTGQGFTPFNIRYWMEI